MESDSTVSPSSPLQPTVSPAQPSTVLSTACSHLHLNSLLPISTVSCLEPLPLTNNNNNINHHLLITYHGPDSAKSFMTVTWLNLAWQPSEVEVYYLPIDWGETEVPWDYVISFFIGKAGMGLDLIPGLRSRFPALALKCPELICFIDMKFT